MTKRQVKLAKEILDYLHELDGGQAGDVLIHAAVNEAIGGVYVPLTEINEVLEICDRNGWIITVPSRFNLDDRGRKVHLRSLSDDGAAARLQMK